MRQCLFETIGSSIIRSVEIRLVEMATAIAGATYRIPGGDQPNNPQKRFLLVWSLHRPPPLFQNLLTRLFSTCQMISCPAEGMHFAFSIPVSFRISDLMGANNPTRLPLPHPQPHLITQMWGIQTVRTLGSLAGERKSQAGQWEGPLDDGGVDSADPRGVWQSLLYTHRSSLRHLKALW